MNWAQNIRDITLKELSEQILKSHRCISNLGAVTKNPGQITSNSLPRK